VLAALEPYKTKLANVNVDTVGIGYGMALHLKDHGLPVTEINVGESSRDSVKYANLKAEYYWGLRMRAQSGDLAGLKDEKTIAQIAGIRYSHNARGQIVIESKEDARKRGVKSPDRAEAVILAFAERPPIVYGYNEYLKQEEAGIDNQQSATIESCSKCGATTCIVRIPGGLRCNHCGNQTFEAPDCKIWTRRDLKF
jgi:hypothetical protein